MTSVSTSRPPVKTRPRQRRPHERSVRVLIRPSPGQPDSYLCITQDGIEAHYWLSAQPSDYGRAFRLEKPGFEGDEIYDVLLDAEGDSCTCPGHTYGGYCRHVDALRALERVGQLPTPDGYKPDGNHQLAF
jgi:hypothetical protein